MIITCNNCQSDVHIPDESRTGGYYVCGKCKQAVTEPVPRERVRTSTDKPIPEDFGITLEQVHVIEKLQAELLSVDRYEGNYYWLAFIGLMIVTVLTGLITLNIQYTLATLFIGIVPAGALASAAIEISKRRLRRQINSRIFRSSSTSVTSYKQALADYEWETKRKKDRETLKMRQSGLKEQHPRFRTTVPSSVEQLPNELTERQELEEYWLSLRGEELENQFGLLMVRLGYEVKKTPSTGDHGIDLIAVSPYQGRGKPSRTMIVQCKGTSRPATESYARDLYGTVMAQNAHKGILVCPKGFSRNTRQYCKKLQREIQLVDSKDLVKIMASRSIELID